MFILKRCLAKRIYIFDVCMSSTPACVFLLAVAGGKGGKLAVERGTILAAALAQLCCSQAAPVQTCIRLTPWGSQEGAKATEGSTRKGKGVVLCLFHPSDL